MVVERFERWIPDRETQLAPPRSDSTLAAARTCESPVGWDRAELPHSETAERAFWHSRRAPTPDLSLIQRQYGCRLFHKTSIVCVLPEIASLSGEGGNLATSGWHISWRLGF